MIVKKKILIIEDEIKIARFLELEFTHEGYDVACESNGRGGLERVLGSEYDLVLLDILLPGLNGMEVCRRIRLKSDVPIIMLTAKDDTADIVTGLDAGVDDYMTKPFAIEELLARVRTTLRKSKDEKVSETISAGELSLDQARRTVHRAGTEIVLTKLEFNLLLYMMKNKGLVLTRDQIIENVWGFDYVGETNVVDVYINYLRNKIDKTYDKKLIVTIRGVGYSVRE